jgi:hypothetical protein
LSDSKLALPRARVNFYEAGSGQEVIRDDWFTLLFEVIQRDSEAVIKVVASVNWCDEAYSQDTRFALKLTPKLFVISITFPNLLSSHLLMSCSAHQSLNLARCFG